ncbi:ABC transporter ATP-binding protein [Candidatus Saccharibacteria bacterium HGW-Saccharibacteria-1]|nr:MAG: ABC transporter ATP-binding protein [Candidatus Saccharibacteria bacterium HGW-Saccharibacteria-1]
METNKNTLRLYWQQIKKYKISFFIALFTIPFSVLFINTLLPYFLSLSIGGLTDKYQPAIWNNLWIAIAIGAIGAILNYIGFQALTIHEAKNRASLSDDTFSELLNKDVGFFVNEKVGALTSRFIDFCRSEVTLQDLLIMKTLGFILSIAIGLIIVAMQSWILAVVMTLLMACMIIEVKWSIKKRAGPRHKRKALNGEINGLIADAFTNNLIVKTFANENREIKILSKKNKDFKELFIKDIGFLATEGSIRNTLMVVIQIISIIICAYMVFNGKMEIAMAIFVLTYLQRVAAQIFELGSMLNGYDQALLEAAPMSEMLIKENLITDKEDAINLKKINPKIDLKDIEYKYSDSSANVIKKINLSITAGEKIGIVGHSGAGKTTITHLLLRFADVTGGQILIDGHDIRNITQKSLRKLIAYVPQEPMLFHRSLRENISYGNLKANDEQIWTAIKQANAYEFIKDLPNGIETTVGERGVKLSGGQRQRIAIARAILKDAPILVLDEATSALDSESEKLIQDSLNKLMKGRTSIVIAHRLSTIAKLDRIIVISGGKIVENGAHNELLKTNGIYAKLWNRQSGGFIEE